METGDGIYKKKNIKQKANQTHRFATLGIKYHSLNIMPKKLTQFWCANFCTDKSFDSLPDYWWMETNERKGYESVDMSHTNGQNSTIKSWLILLKRGSFEN